MLKLFTPVEGDPKTWFSEVETPGDDGVVPLDRLAQARIAFATNPNLARRIIGEFWDAQWPLSPAVPVRRIATPINEDGANGGAARAETRRELGFRALAGAWHTWRAPRA